MTLIGQVAELYRYPVKSMLGERLEACAVEARGLSGDRTHALIDAVTSKVASAKRPQLWRDLLSFAAMTIGGETASVAPTIQIRLPDGRTMFANDPGIDAVLSEALGRSVRMAATIPEGIEIERSHPDEVLSAGVASAVTFDTMTLAAAAPTGGFFDYAPVHVMAQASFDRIAAAAPDSAIDIRRYRPNLVIADVDEPFAENAWLGRSLCVGDALVLRIVAPTPRCAIPTLAQCGLPAEPRALRAVADLNRAEFPGFGLQPCLGAYAEVVTAGHIRFGDAVRFLN